MTSSFIHIIPLFLIIGAIAGFLAGMLGIGGGILLVPLFSWSFKYLGLGNLSFHMAIATSLSVVMWAATSGAITHNHKRWVDRFALPYLVLGGFIGVAVGSTLASLINGEILEILFCIFVILVGLKLLLGDDIEKIDKPLSKPKHKLILIGMACGSISSFFGIGAGVLMVPMLLFLSHYPIHMAIGTSAGNIAIVSALATIFYIYHGSSIPGRPPFSLGYIYLPATIFVSIPALLMARVGAKTAHVLPIMILRRVFGLLLIAVAAKVSYSAIF